MRFAAVLWDLDGVLVDSSREHFAAFRALMEEQGRSLSEEEFAPLFGLQNDDILRRLLGEDLSREELDELAERKEALFRERIRDNVRPLPGASELARRLHEAGGRQAIVSSTPRANIDLILDALGLAAVFSVRIAAEDAERGKPDPQGFLLAAERLGVAPERCVVLEDAPEGIEAGKAAGMAVAGVATTRRREQLGGADLVVERLDDPELVEFLGLR